MLAKQSPPIDTSRLRKAILASGVVETMPNFDSSALKRLAEGVTASRSQPVATIESPRRPATVPAKPAKRRAKRIPTDEHIARRVVKRHRGAAVALLGEAGLTHELKELTEIEARLRERTPPACKHAAFSARNLMEGVADCLFPPTEEKRRDRDNHEHSLGPSDHKNRLIAYAEERLTGKWEGHEFRSFVATMDVVMRWTGSGPHGAYKLEEAEQMYTRLLDALAVIARAFVAE